MLPEKKQILVVDDEANLRRVLTASAFARRLRVHSAPDGEAGLACFAITTSTHHHRSSSWPRMDGLELLRQALRTTPELPWSS